MNDRRNARASLFPTLSLGALCALGAPAAATVLYVDDDAPATGNGSSWVTAFRSIQDALATARADASVSEIRVAQGTYRPADDAIAIEWGWDRTATFQLVENVPLRGGYAGLAAPSPDTRSPKLYETILSGDLAGDDDEDPIETNWLNYEENVYHVVSTPSPSGESLFFIEGFTIRGGSADGSPPHNSGGGVYFADHGLFMQTIAMVRECRIVFNRADAYGGGLFAHAGAAVPVVDTCRIEMNVATNGGGAAFGDWELPLESTPEIVDTILSANSAATAGGGAFFGWSVDPQIIRSTFSGNAAQRSGGGIRYASECSSFLIASVVSGNSSANGGGIYEEFGAPFFANSLITDNVASQYGGGIWWGDSSGHLSSSTLAGNSAFAGGAIYSPSPFWPTVQAIENSILWGNAASSGGPEIALEDQPEGSAFMNVLNIDASIVAGGAEAIDAGALTIWTLAWSADNLESDPLFVDANGSDNSASSWFDNQYRLVAGSPAIDAGEELLVAEDVIDLDGDDNLAEALPFDLSGGSRTQGAAIDVGAFEHRPCAGDVDADGFVGFSDLVAVVLGWGGCGAICTLDADANGEVGFGDLTALLSGWGACP